MGDGLDALRNKRAERTRRIAPPPRHPRQERAEDHQGQAAAPPAAEPAAGAGPRALGAGLVGVLPQPQPSQAEGPLNEREREHLAVCEAAIDHLRRSFIAAGQALQVIRDGRLYRETHTTFEDYCQDRWEMTRQQASRLIQAWPLGARLSPMGDKINERQVRALLPIEAQHGQDAAVTVYSTVAQHDGVRVTADLLDQAVKVLPETWDEAEVIARIRAFLAGELTPALPAPARAVETFAGRARQLQTLLHRVIADDVLQAAAAEDPDQVRQLAAELRAAADRLDARAQPSA